MRQYRPDAANLVSTVAAFLERIGPKLESGDRYEALVCRHILTMVERELTAPAEAERDDAAFVRAIRAGEFDGAWERLVEDLLAESVARVMIVKPDHLAEKHRAAK